jgi:hypothetical protein
MNQLNNKDAPVLNQKQAEQIIRMFNVGFNSALLYGGDHPTTTKNIEPFIALIIKELQSTPVVSIIIDRESLFIDEFCADKVINPKRIIAQFSKSAIQSVSFDSGVGQRDIQEFFKLAGDIKTVPRAEQIQISLKNNGYKGIRLNHIRYGKITSDETLISKNSVLSSGIENAAFNGTLSKSAVEEIEKIISLARLLDQPQETAASFTKSITDEKSAIAAAGTIARIRGEVQGTEPQSIESLLNAVFELKVDLSEALAAQKLTGKILAAAEPAQKQMDNLTCEVLAKLVNEEYSNGDMPIKRLAQIIRRMLPDLSELKRVLPLLKNTLLAEGMSLTDYLRLIRLIDLEIESESLASIIDDAASGIGVSTEEVVKAIRSQPNDAAKLMFLAAEIRQGTDQDDAQLSKMLTEYVEKVSTSIALDSKDVTGPQGSKMLGKIISHVENQLCDKLKSYGIDEPVLLKVKALLEDRFNATHENTSTQWMVNNISLENGGEIQSLADKLTAFMGQEQLLPKLTEPLIESLTSRGYGKKHIEDFIKKLSNQIASGKKIILPSNVLSSNNMLFLLNREIKQHFRYDTPFSTLMISIYLLHFSDGSVRKPLPEERSKFTDTLFSLVKDLLRDIDLIGSVDSSEEHSIFTLLTMTGEDGAIVVQRRIIQKISTTQFKYKDSSVKIEPLVSITSPVKEITKDLSLFLEVVKSNHQRELNKMKLEVRS